VHQKILQNKYIQTVALLVLISTIFSSCIDCTYKIRKDYIKSTCAFTQGFYIYEIEVDSFNRQKLPEDYRVIRKVSLSLKEEGMKPSKKIYFYKENKNYEWHDINNATLSQTLPIEVKQGKWYIIRALVFRGHPDRAAYLYINEEGELQVHGYSESTNF